MAYTEEKFSRQLTLAELKLEEIVELSGSENTRDISFAYEQIEELIKRLEKAKNDTAEYFLETDRDLEYVKKWTTIQKGSIKSFR